MPFQGRRKGVPLCPPMWPRSSWHDAGELRRIGQLQIAGARHLNLALHHEAARAFAHAVHRVGQKHALAQVVRDQDHIEALRLPQVAQGAPQLFTGEGVEGAKRLVEQQHLGPVDQRAADAGALLHAAGEFPGELGAPCRPAPRSPAALAHAPRIPCAGP